MTHDIALISGYGLTALALVIELIALRRQRRQALARLVEARDEARADALEGSSTAT